MKWIDEKYRKNRVHYILQCLLAGVAMAMILVLLRNISNSAVIASLGASVFIAFGLHHQPTSRPRLLIGGYIVGLAVGSLGFWFHSLAVLPETLWAIPEFPVVAIGAATVALSIFVMVITNTEHPPAAGLALGFVLLTELRWITPAAVLAGVLLLALTKTLLRPFLRDLL